MTVEQSHNGWVAVDPAARVSYSMDGFSDDAVVRYELAAGWKPLDRLPLDARIERVQGGDIRDGFRWLSTDDATDGDYRVDLGTGHVDLIGSADHVDGECEGIDATVLPSGDLHVLSVDKALVPVRLVNLAVR